MNVFPDDNALTRDPSSEPLRGQGPGPAMEMEAAHHAGAIARAALGSWLVASLLVSASGVMAGAPLPLVPVLIWSPVIASGVLFQRSPSFRAWALSVDPRALVTPHAIRVAAGASFLVMLAQGKMPAVFALPAGWGDIVAGGLAPLVALVYRPTPGRRRLLLAWNALALVDIVMVFLSAQRLIFFVHDEQMFAALSSFPFSMLPLFVVPLVLMTHLLLFAQLRMAARGEAKVPG
jgi:hypothetical protein